MTCPAGSAGITDPDVRYFYENTDPDLIAAWRDRQDAEGLPGSLDVTQLHYAVALAYAERRLRTHLWHVTWGPQELPVRDGAVPRSWQVMMCQITPDGPAHILSRENIACDGPQGQMARVVEADVVLTALLTMGEDIL